MKKEVKHRKHKDENDTSSQGDSHADEAKPFTEDHSEPTRPLPSMTAAGEGEERPIELARAWKAAVQKLLEDYVAWSTELVAILAEADQRRSMDQAATMRTTPIHSEHNNNAVSPHGSEGAETGQR